MNISGWKFETKITQFFHKQKELILSSLYPFWTTRSDLFLSHPETVSYWFYIFLFSSSNTWKSIIFTGRKPHTAWGCWVTKASGRKTISTAAFWVEMPLRWPSDRYWPQNLLVDPMTSVLVAQGDRDNLHPPLHRHTYTPPRILHKLTPWIRFRQRHCSARLRR